MSWTNFFLAYQGREDRDLQRRYGEFHRRMLEPVLPRYFEPPTPHAPRERIRVGFFSHFFFNCTAGRYFRSWVTDLDRTRFEVYVYYTNDWMANDTREIAASAQVFRHLAGWPLARIAEQVAADQLDVLVYPELGMHADTYTLAGLRLAPVQCCGWGHPTTSGHAAIDWFISCAEMEPPHAQEQYTERLALLPGLGTRYAVPREVTPVTRAQLGIPEGTLAYLVPQSLFKIHPDNDAILADVLAANPGSVLVMFASVHERVTDTFARRLQRAFIARGVDLQQRVIFLAPNLPHASYLGVNRVCDAMLDTLHWSGGNTSLDALASGLPVVTLPGTLMRGRQSAAMLSALGVGELIARDAGHYVELATQLGRRRELREELSRRIAANASALFDRPEPVKALDRFLAGVARA
jgi:CRISPR-associated protein Csy1